MDEGSGDANEKTLVTSVALATLALKEMEAMRRHLCAVVALGLGTLAHAGAPLFSDDFTNGPSSLWGNEIGNWTVTNGAYSATAPGNFPNAHSSLPYIFGSCLVDVDINDVADGGIWVRSAPAPGTPVGVKGVLLVTGGGVNGASGIYWHIVSDGQGYGPAIAAASGLWTPGVSDVHVRVTVVGDTYTAFVNGRFASSVTTNLFPAGCIALYDRSLQTFDNVSVSGEVLCELDLSCDLVVDAADLAILLGAWGQPGIADLDDNGTTDAADLAILLGEWGPCA
jgi:hypothetical protein